MIISRPARDDLTTLADIPIHTMLMCLGPPKGYEFAGCKLPHTAFFGEGAVLVAPRHLVNALLKFTVQGGRSSLAVMKFMTASSDITRIA